MSSYSCQAVEHDKLDELAEQWSQQRPDLDDVSVMALVGRLLVVAALIRKRLDGFAAEHGVQVGEADVLFTLRRAGEPFRLAPSRLTGSLLVTSGTMTNRLDRLEQRGLIRRRPNPADRRGLDVELTAKGRKLTDRAIAEHVANEQAMLAPLSPTERDQLARTLRKLLAHLQHPLQERG